MGGRLVPLRRHLLVLVLAVVTPLVVFSVLVSGRLAQRERAAVEERLLDEARALALALDQEFQTSIAALQTLAHSDPLDRADLQAFSAQFTRTRDERGWHSGASLLAPDGTEVLNIAHAPGSAGGLLFGARPYFEEVLATGRPTVSDLIASRRPGEFGVVFAVPVVRHGVITGVLVAGITTHRLSAMIGSSSFTDSTRAIVDRDGRIAARSGRPEDFVGRPATPDFLEQVRRDTSGHYRATTIDGRRVHGAFSRATVWGWTAAVAVPAAVLDAPLWRSLLLVAGTGVGLLGLGVAAAFVLARRIVVPVQAATTAAQALARDDVEPAPATSILELAELGDALRQTGSLLHAREDARRRADGERETARRQLEAANRTKDEFLAMLSHELRNPLAAIMNATGVLDRIGARDDIAIRAREIVKRQAKHLQRLVDDLLDVARVTERKVVLHREPIDLRATVERCVGALDASGRLAQHPVEPELAPAWIDADPTRVEQIVTNVLANAIRYTPGGGRITVRVSAEGSDAVLRVADTGVGIAPELLPRIFDLFTQGERGLARKEGGLGIGLTLVRQLTELHGGRVEAHSEGPGRGSEFVVRFPRIAAPAKVPGQDASGSATVPRLRVLLVEDNEDAREALRALLEVEGHEVLVATTGQQALDAVRAVTPDIALIDIGLPDIDGYEVARRLRSLGVNGTRLVAVTGYGHEQDRRRALEAGFDAHVVKPVEPDRLAGVLRDASYPG